MPRNIPFMRIRVRVDLWLPVIVGFVLRLDDGSQVWIQCRSMKHGCVLGLGCECGCGCGTRQFLKKVGAGAGAAGLDN